mgnify:CR=1 FL=1
MDENSFRVSIQERIAPGNNWSHSIDVKDLRDLIDQLKEEKITKISLKHITIFTDYETIHKNFLSIDELREDDFKYLTEDRHGYSTYLVVEHMRRK